MNRLETIQEQLRELVKKKKQIMLCQSKIGEYVFDLYHDDLIQDDGLKIQIKNIINEVEVTEVEVKLTDLMGIQK